MNKLRFKSILLVLTIILATSCKYTPTKGTISSPPDAKIRVAQKHFVAFDAPARHTLLRYFAGSPAWSLIKDRTRTYAVKRAFINGQYASLSNGFQYQSNPVRQTRILVAFGKTPHGFGHEYGNVTRTWAMSGPTQLIVEGTKPGTPGNTSYLIVKGKGMFVEIHQQTPRTQRTFTQNALDALDVELAEVLKHRIAINTHGVMPVPGRYQKMPLSTSFKISDGFQPGIYNVDAAITPNAQGTAYIKAFNVKTGARLSEDRLTPASSKLVGWSNDGKSIFPYTTGIVIYEGDWSTTYKARFELWHKAINGKEQKLAEHTRLIHGWQR